MRVLLVESEAEDAVYLRDVLTEIEEGQYWNHWVKIEMLHAGSWTQASSMLEEEPVDIVLLDIDVFASEGIETFRRAQKVAQDIPMVLLVGESEELLGLRLVRDGAQDFLVKKQVDCAPLAHAMQNAIERNRLVTAIRAGSTQDSLTGLPNRLGFLRAADRDRKLAERLGQRLMVLVAEPECFPEITTAYGQQLRDLALVKAADHLRSLAGPADLLARIELTRFGMTIFDAEAESLEAAWSRIQRALRPHRIRIGSAILGRNAPVTLDALLEEASKDLFPNAVAIGI